MALNEKLVVTLIATIVSLYTTEGKSVGFKYVFILGCLQVITILHSVQGLKCFVGLGNTSKKNDMKVSRF